MLKSRRTFSIVGAVLAAALFSSSGVLLASPPVGNDAKGRCDGADIATGPFAYSSSSAIAATFQGNQTASVTGSFTVTASSPNKQTDEIDVFPGEGQDQDATCPQLADAEFRVVEIVKDLNADGSDLAEPLKIEGALFGQIAAAFVFSPPDATFAPGLSVDVEVKVSNPNVADSNYGRYRVKLGSKAPGAGIGVGQGQEVVLVLKAVELVDRTPPTINISSPTADEVLGPIQIAFTAVDPSPGSGVNSMSAVIKSAAAINQIDSNPGFIAPVDLNTDSLPIAAGLTTSASGTFDPVGGTGPAGTTLAGAFTASNRSGIGNYTLFASAEDVAGNEATNSMPFAVRYDVGQSLSTSGNCNQLSNNGCAVATRFTVNRSIVTSDGAFMYDTTVVVKLVRKLDQVVVDTHTYGASGDPKDVVKFDLSEPQYMTTFKRSEFDEPAVATNVVYQVKVYFKDVDGNLSLQGTSGDVTL